MSIKAVVNQININLIVIHSQDLEISKKFYETLGISFLYEQHGSGRKHLSAVLEGVVFEIYPRSDNVDTSAVRLGFRVPSVDKAIEDLEKIGVVVLSNTAISVDNIGYLILKYLEKS